jgi:protein Tex
MTMDPIVPSHAKKIASLINARPSQVDSTVRLLDEGNTVPFIARYRKEMTGSLDDEQVRIVADEIIRLRAIDERRAAILKSIEEQGKLTDELKAAIQAAETMTALEDLYAPYKPKRRTRAMVAREKRIGTTGRDDPGPVAGHRSRRSRRAIPER